MAVRKRMRFTFWLNTRDYAERRVADLIDQLKAEGAFTQTIRDGLRLMVDLRHGRTTTLLEMFPWVAEAVAPAPAPGDGEVLREIARLRDLILAQQAAPAFPPPPRDTPALRPLTALDEEGDVVLTVTATKATNSAANFLGSLLALQQ